MMFWVKLLTMSRNLFRGIREVRCFVCIARPSPGSSPFDWQDLKIILIVARVVALCAIHELANSWPSHSVSGMESGIDFWHGV